jgi:hypothetical protein
MVRSHLDGERSPPPAIIKILTIAFGAPALIASGFLSGCPKQGPICGEGFSRCALACADLASDALNCGACGLACRAGEICQTGRCQCPAEATLCGDFCVNPNSDPANCGGCVGTDGGRACSAQQVCELGQCQTRCTSPGSTQCGQSCVDLASNVNNCGVCGRTCMSAQSCHQGLCTYDVVAACFNTGQVVGIQGNTALTGARVGVGSFPQSLGSVYDVLLVADGIDQRLRQAKLEDFSLLPGDVRLGASPNHIWVDDPYVYVVNSLGNTLQILQRQASPEYDNVPAPDGGIVRQIPDGGLFPAGLQLTTVGEINLGPASSPQAILKIGDDLYIPLWGGSGQVARVNVTNPTNPMLTKVFNLGALDLQSFDGGTTFARPIAIASAWGRIYVALENLDIAFLPAGPGMLAKIDPSSESVTAINLGCDACLNTFWLSATDDALYISCSGKIVYGPGFEILSVDKSGVVVLNQNEDRVSTWNVSCAPKSKDCIPPSVGRFAIFNHNRLYLGDQAGGRVFVVESLGDLRLVERRGHNPVDGGPPILACPREQGMLSLVIDVVAVP